MELITAFDTAFEEWDRLVHQVGDGQWDGRTPCTQWSVRLLVNHLVGEHLWAPHVLSGATVEEVGRRFHGDLVGLDPVDAWERAGSESHRAFHRKGALKGEVHVTAGRIAAEEYGWQMTCDLTVHGWDLAQAVGVRSRMKDELADSVYVRIAPQVASWQGAGVFEPPVPVVEDAPPQDRLLGLLGRRPQPEPGP
jgi:uncharacterized protein (TIGR03086 family)